MMEVILSSDVFTILVRLTVALICGGLLGIERGSKKRPAGFRTYMLVCVGSALVMMTNSFIAENHPNIDPSRMAAQVISGIGFLGAGTIIVTGRNRVKGLTTAAGLWVAACVGLSVGAGYYVGAIAGCLLTFFVMAALHSLDESVMSSTKVMEVFVQFTNVNNIGAFMDYIKEYDIRVSEMEFMKNDDYFADGIGVLMTLHMDRRRSHLEIKRLLSKSEGVAYIEEV